MRITYVVIVTILSVLLIVLQVDLWTGKGSIQDVRHLEQAISLQTVENKKLKERNDALLAEVKDLKRGLEAIEERARTNFGMIHKDETFFQIVNPSAQ